MRPLGSPSVVKKAAAHALRVGGNEEVGPVAPALQEPPEILPAELIALVVVQFGPLAVFMAN